MTRELRIASRLTQLGLTLMVGQSGIAQKLHRKVIFYLLHMECGVALPAIATANACSKQNVSKHIREVEALRDQDPHLDAALSALEQRIAEV